MMDVESDLRNFIVEFVCQEHTEGLRIIKRYAIAALHIFLNNKSKISVVQHKTNN